LLLLWMQYGFHFHAAPDGRDDFNRAMADKIGDLKIESWRTLLSFCDRWQLLPRAYIWGLADTVRAGVEGRGQNMHFLWGQLRLGITAVVYLAQFHCHQSAARTAGAVGRGGHRALACAVDADGILGRRVQYRHGVDASRGVVSFAGHVRWRATCTAGVCDAGRVGGCGRVAYRARSLSRLQLPRLRSDC
jgi:hypothetical protein